MDNTHTHTITVGRFEVTVQTSIVGVREVEAPDATQDWSGAEVALDVNAYRRSVEPSAANDKDPRPTEDDLARAAKRVHDVKDGDGTKAERWTAMADLLELWVARHGTPPAWGAEVEVPGKAPISIGHWAGNERGRYRNGLTTQRQAERLTGILGPNWWVKRRSFYGAG